MKRIAVRSLTAMLCMALLTALAFPAFAAEFSDVPAGHWAREAISSCERRGIVSGYSNGAFQPEKPVTNAQFVAMLTRAFYPDAVAQYASSEAAAYEAWWWPNWRVMLDTGMSVLTGLNGVSAFQESANNSITRYNMAQMLYNVLKEKGFSVPDTERAAVKKEVGDWSRIPVKYRDAVVAVYALGVTGGQSDGKFGGENFMNRAQGCTVIERMRKVLADGVPKMPTSSEPVSQPEAPTVPAAPAKPEIPPVVNAVPESPPVVNTVPDAPPYVPEEQAEAVLANGEDVSEENVLAVLEELKEQYPDGTAWGSETTRPGTPSKALDDTIKRSYFHQQGGLVSMRRACGGFASLVSDTIFGSDSANPARKLDNLANIRPGDVIIKLDANGRLTHVSIALARPSEAVTFYGVTAYRIDAWSGNINDGIVYSGKSTLPVETANGFYCEAWTRYPEG